MQRSEFMTGFILGGILGAAVAILYTPSSGRSLRTQARDYVENVRREMQQANVNRRIELEQELEELRSTDTPNE
jgi:gas vesicle protein